MKRLVVLLVAVVSLVVGAATLAPAAKAGPPSQPCTYSNNGQRVTTQTIWFGGNVFYREDWVCYYAFTGDACCWQGPYYTQVYGDGGGGRVQSNKDKS